MKSIYKVKKDRSKYKLFSDLQVGDYLYNIDYCKQVSIYQIRKIRKTYVVKNHYKLHLYLDTIIGDSLKSLNININFRPCLRDRYDGTKGPYYWTSDKRVFLNKLKNENI